MEEQRKQLLESFHNAVGKYKNAMRCVREEKNPFRRAFYGLHTFGSSYFLHTLLRFKFPLPKGDIQGSFFWEKNMSFPRRDIGSYSLSMYGMIPHRSERKLTEYLIRTLGVKDVFYDIGAHLGFYTALAETLLMEGKVFAFEANDTLCAYLNKNFGNESRVTVVCSAVASVPGTVEFYDATNTSDSSMSSRFNISGSIISTRKVSTVILDTFVTSAVTPPTIMKFDIEGGEYDAICGAEKIIQTFKPTIILEVWGGKLGRTYSQNAIEKLFALGYEAFSIGSNGMLSTEAVLDPVSSIVGTEEGVRDNFVFIHTEIRK